MVSKRAAEFLAADLRAVIQELEALDNGIREMEAKREAVQLKATLLKRAVGPESQGELPLPKNPQASLAEVVPPPTAELPQNGSGGPGTGFRSAIREVLAEAVRGMRP